jgi:hypothetical protein
MSFEYVGRFLGPEEIISVDVNTVTKDGVEVLDVKSRTEAGVESVRRFTREGLAVSVSDERKDWNHVQEARFTPIVSEITKLMIAMGVRGGEIDALLQQVGRNMSNALDKAVYVKWNGTSEGHVPGGNPYFDFTITEADNIIN